MNGTPPEPIVILPGETGPRSSGSGGNFPGLQVLAHLLDSAFQIPGLKVRVGLDALLGVIPGLGDVGTSLLSLVILSEANRRGVPRVTMARMTANVAIDTALGAVPIVGDLFDIYWKANERNVALLQRHASPDPQHVRRAERSDRLFFAGMIAVILTCLAVSLTVAFFAVRWILGVLSGS